MFLFFVFLQFGSFPSYQEKKEEVIYRKAFLQIKYFLCHFSQIYEYRNAHIIVKI